MEQLFFTIIIILTLSLSLSQRHTHTSEHLTQARFTCARMPPIKLYFNIESSTIVRLWMLSVTLKCLRHRFQCFQWTIRPIFFFNVNSLSMISLMCSDLLVEVIYTWLSIFPNTPTTLWPITFLNLPASLFHNPMCYARAQLSSFDQLCVGSLLLYCAHMGGGAPLFISGLI